MFKKIFDFSRSCAEFEKQPSEACNFKDYSWIAEQLVLFADAKSDVIITVTGLNHYFGDKPFEVGKTVHLVKEPGNKYDSNAIAVYIDEVGKVGYVANSEHTVKQGTVSADLLYGAFRDTGRAEILWAEEAYALCSVCRLSFFDLLYNNGVYFFRDKDFDSALRVFLVLEKENSEVNLIKRISECYLNVDDFKKALCYANKAVEISPEDKGAVLLKKTILERS